MPFTTEEWDEATSWEEYLGRVEQHASLWRRHWEKAEIDDLTRRRLEDLPGPRRVLILTEDWCGDAVRSVPWIVKACRAAPDVEVRVIDIANHEALMSRHLTKGAKAIPVAIVEDESGRDLGWWGPRPAPLQALLRERLLEQGRPPKDALGEFYAPILAWYATDAGRTLLAELLLLLERS